MDIQSPVRGYVLEFPGISLIKENKEKTGCQIFFQRQPFQKQFLTKKRESDCMSHSLYLTYLLQLNLAKCKNLK